MTVCKLAACALMCFNHSTLDLSKCRNETGARFEKCYNSILLKELRCTQDCINKAVTGYRYKCKEKDNEQLRPDKGN